MLEKGFSFHYFEENDQYRIERSPVITGDLKTMQSSLLQERTNVPETLHCVRSPTTSWSPIMTWPPASNVRPLPQPFASNK